MTGRLEVYRCNICGNIVEVLHSGLGELVCCGEPMELLEEKAEDVGLEEHVPVVEETDKGVRVKVGSVPHPMEESHHIEWIEIITEGRVYRKFLNPGDSPEAEFEIEAGGIEARVYCNLHGLWRFSFAMSQPKSDIEKAPLRDKLTEAIEEFNKYRVPEIEARLISHSEASFEIEFTGTFCETCGFYDYFEDFVILLEEFELMAEIAEIKEIDEGALVEFKVKSC